MKIIIGIFIGLGIAFVIHKKYYPAATTTLTTTIPNTPQAFFAAVASGQLTINKAVGAIYNIAGTQIGKWTTDGSVYDMNGNLIAPGTQAAK